MGLDMYLNAKRYISQYREAELGAALAKEFPELVGRSVNGVTVEVMYWRKSNAIHKWFVDNVQKGTDDCGTYYVSRATLEALRDLILEILDTRDASKLPPASGFFFGSTDIDDWFWQDLEKTVKNLAVILDEFSEKEWDFEYHSSW